MELWCCSKCETKFGKKGIIRLIHMYQKLVDSYEVFPHSDRRYNEDAYYENVKNMNILRELQKIYIKHIRKEEDSIMESQLSGISIDENIKGT